MIDKAERVKMRADAQSMVHCLGPRAAKGRMLALLDALDEAAELVEAVETWRAELIGLSIERRNDGVWRAANNHIFIDAPTLPAAIRAALEEAAS